MTAQRVTWSTPVRCWYQEMSMQTSAFGRRRSGLCRIVRPTGGEDGHGPSESRRGMMW